LSFEANLSREKEGTRMTTVCLSEKVIASLENLDEPLDFCDESGHLLGSFIPEAAMQELRPLAEAEGDLRAVEGQLGPEMCVFGFETDLE
jgi:hypothetical protein